MHKNNWNHLNRMPAAIRKKTTEYNLLLFAKLLKEEREKNIRHTPDEVLNLLDHKDSLYKYIKSPHMFSTLNGYQLLNEKGARRSYADVLEVASLEYANQFITVWIRDDWRTLQEVYTEL